MDRIIISIRIESFFRGAAYVYGRGLDDGASPRLNEKKTDSTDYTYYSYTDGYKKFCACRPEILPEMVARNRDRPNH